MNKNFIEKVFEEFNKKNVLIIGDVMIDSYLEGNIDRISPEAPVPIITSKKKEDRLGGAANVALNIKSLGAKPYICTIIGDDDNGLIFNNLIDKRNISNKGIIISKKRKTTSKTRIISQGQHLLRIDDEICTNLDENEENLIIERIIRIIEKEEIDVIIFEDYDKGVITSKVISKTISFAKEKNIPTTVDPKKNNFLKYKNITLFKPNLKELSEGLNIKINKNINIEIKNAVDILMEKLNSEIVFTTLSEKGCYIKNKFKEFHFPAEIRKIADVSGAGDTVISVASLCLSSKMEINDIAYISNIAGGLVCESVGVVSIDKQELLKEILKN